MRLNDDNQVDLLSAAVMVCDVKEPVIIPGLQIEEGHLAVPPEEFISKRPSLVASQLQSVEYGGGGNVVLPAAALGIKTGLVGIIGNDIEGGFFAGGISGYGVNISGLITDDRYRSDVSFIPQDETGNRAPITFCEDAGKHFDFANDVKDRLVIANPKIVQISYSGLFEEGADLDGGRRLAEGISWIKENLESLVMVDTHTYAAEPQRYECLKPSLEVADMFVCSDDEVNLIVPQYNLPTAGNNKKAFLTYLENNFCKGDEARLYAITSPEKTSLLYYHPGDGTKEIEVDNWFHTSKEEGKFFDTTGAGDSWRAGLNSYILNRLDDYKSGKLDVEQAVQMANLTARLYISGRRTEGFRQYNFGGLFKFLTQGRPNADLKTPEGLYQAIDTAIAR